MLSSICHIRFHHHRTRYRNHPRFQHHSRFSLQSCNHHDNPELGRFKRTKTRSVACIMMLGWHVSSNKKEAICSRKYGIITQQLTKIFLPLTTWVVTANASIKRWETMEVKIFMVVVVMVRIYCCWSSNKKVMIFYDADQVLDLWSKRQNDLDPNLTTSLVE